MSNGASSDSSDADILSRLAAGDTVDDEITQSRAAFLERLTQHHVLSAARDELATLGQSGPSVDVATSLAQVRSRLGMSAGHWPEPTPLGQPTATPGVLAPAQSISPAARQSSRARWYTWGGAFLGMLLLAIGWQSGIHHMRSTITGRASVYTTANGQRATIALPDGSTAILNVGSRLEVPADYAAGNRTLRLAGEALFTVHHQTNAPFTVLAGASRTQVLGTSFVVRHYAGDSSTFVAVRDGKVAVQSVVLTAMQEVDVHGAHAGRVRTTTAGQFTFATGVLTLDDTPLSDAITTLNRWYDADIQLGDASLAPQSIKGRFKAGSLSDLTEILEWTLNVQVVRNGRILTLYPRS